MQEELIEGVAIRTGATAIDCTAGGGGHTEPLLRQSGPSGRVLAIDRDPNARAHLRRRFARELDDGRLFLAAGPFSRLRELVEEAGLGTAIDAIIADVGVSSPQIDSGERGFSFRTDGPLDMRMNQEEGETAAGLLARLSEDELTHIFRSYGEEPAARPVARAIIRRREEQPLQSTVQLADLVKSVLKYKEKSKKHPATRIFQGLRIAVNHELEELGALLNSGFDLLRPGGRMGIISFHSLEDRLVKQHFNQLVGKGKKGGIPREIPVTDQEINRLRPRSGRLVKPYPIMPSEEEIQENPRARSARLRIIEKLI